MLWFPRLFRSAVKEGRIIEVAAKEPLSNMANMTNLNKKLTEAQLKDLEAMLRDKAFTHKDIAKVYGVPHGVISYYAIKHGIRRQAKPRGKGQIFERPSEWETGAQQVSSDVAARNHGSPRRHRG